MKEKLDNLDNKKKGGDNRFFRPELGVQEIRFLPSEDKDPFKEFWFHYNLKTTVMCPKRNFNEECPVCEYATSLWKEGTDESKKMAKELFSRQRFFANVIVRGKEEEGPKPYGFGKELFKKLLSTVLDPDYGDITDADKGRDVKLTYEKADLKKFPTSDITIKPVTKPILGTKKEVKDILDKIQPLDSFMDRKTPAEVKEILERFLEDPMADDSERKMYGSSVDKTSDDDTEVKDIDSAIDELTA